MGTQVEVLVRDPGRYGEEVMCWETPAWWERGGMTSVLSKFMPTYMCSGIHSGDLHVGNSPPTPFPSVKLLRMWAAFLLLSL